MKCLLDTDVVSTYQSDKPNARIDAWLERVDSRDLYLSTVTYAELWYGIHLLPMGKKRTRLETWVKDELETLFINRCVSFGQEAARQYGLLLARVQQNGYTVNPLDTMIAAIAVVEGMTVATLNRKDFEKLGVSIVEF